MSRETPRSPEWAAFYRNHPEVVASWAEANGRAVNCPCEPCESALCADCLLLLDGHCEHCGECYCEDDVCQDDDADEDD